MNPQNSVPPSSNSPTPPQVPQPPKPGAPVPPQRTVSSPAPLPVTPPATPPSIPLSQPEVQAISAGERPLVIPSVNGSSPTAGEVVQVPGGIVFLAWYYLINGILSLIGCVLLIPILIVFGVYFHNILGSTLVPQSLLIYISIFILAFLIPISTLYILMFLGFKRLRRWSLIAYFVLFVLSTAVVLFSLFKEKFNVITVVSLGISILIAYYVWTKRSLFKSKQEALAYGITFEAKLPIWGKILIGIYIALPIIGIAALIWTFSVLGFAQKNLPIPNSPMASIPPIIQKSASESGQATNSATLP